MAAPTGRIANAHLSNPPQYDERIMCTRARVPILVAALGRALMNGDCVYLHCTAGETLDLIWRGVA